MKLALLTSSRADYGFYRPLLKKIAQEETIKFSIVVFGTHLSTKHGNTYREIERDGYRIFSKIDCLPVGDSPQDIVDVIGELHLKFAAFWQKNEFDLILSIGDRYEMFAAVSASVPFNYPVAHISGGEETLGAIDNKYRHMLSLMSDYHFVNTQRNADRVVSIIGSNKGVYHTGSLAIDNILNTDLYSLGNFESKYGFDLKKDFILFTFHPETVGFRNNLNHSHVIKSILSETGLPILATMPNADTSSETIRKVLAEAAELNTNVVLFESLGTRGYYTAMKHCSFVLGNSSSGIIEAASFGKYVINIGSRQKGREYGENVLQCEIEKEKILELMNNIPRLPRLSKKNIYGGGNASERILGVLKKIFE